MSHTPSVPRPSAGGRYERGTLEFDRVANFSDAIYAIALTLLVIDIDAPTIADASNRRQLLDALVDLGPKIITFFVSFVVIGSFWVAHHRFVGRLAAIDRLSVRVNLAYLAVVACLPLPAGVLGEYADNAVAVVFYAAFLAVLSTLESVLLWFAWRGGLYRRPVTRPVVRFGLAASLIPVGMFVLSVPFALIDARLAIGVWFLAFPAEALLERFKPPGADEFYA